MGHDKGSNFGAWLVYRWQVWLRGLQSGWERLSFEVFRTPVAALLFVLGVVAWIGDMLDPFADRLPQTPTWNAVIWGLKFVALGLAIVGAIGLGDRLWRLFRPKGDYELRKAAAEHGVGLKGFTESADGLLLVRGHNGVVAVNASVGAELDQGSHGIEVQEDRYDWPEELQMAAKLARRTMNRLTLNEHKLGLRTEIDSVFMAGNRPVVMQRTRYFFDRTTNSVLDKDVWSRSREQRVWRGRDHFISEDDRLIRLERAGASNQLGGSTLVIDQSRQVYLTMQAATSAESPDLLAPSGSGSFDLLRYRARATRRKSLTFQQFCRGEVERELLEETALKANALELRTFLIGFGRFLYRGGKPEVFGVSALRRETAEARVSDRERLWTAGHEAVALDELQAWDDARLAEVSAPLAANIVLLRRYLDSEGAREFWNFLDGSADPAIAPI